MKKLLCLIVFLCSGFGPAEGGEILDLIKDEKICVRLVADATNKPLSKRMLYEIKKEIASSPLIYLDSDSILSVRVLFEEDEHQTLFSYVYTWQQDVPNVHEIFIDLGVGLAGSDRIKEQAVFFVANTVDTLERHKVGCGISRQEEQ